MERKWFKFRDDYAVSNFGEVKSLEKITRNGRHIKERILKPQLVAGYLAVYLPNPETGKQKWEYIHRLVANAFIPNPDNLQIVNHKNQITTDNRVENLEWCTPAYNIQYSLCKKGIYGDEFLELTEEEKKEYQQKKRKENAKKYRKEHYVPKMDHTIYVYKPVVKTEYKLVAQYDKITEAAEALKTTVGRITSRVSKDKPTKTLLKKDGKEYLITREIL